MHGEMTIPSDLLRRTFPYGALKDSVHGEQALSEEHVKEFERAVKTMALAAASYLSKAREKQGQVAKSARSALLPVIPALHYLSRLEKSGYKVFDPALGELHRFQLMMMLARTWLTGVF